jgi:hypothetical protein
MDTPAEASQPESQLTQLPKFDFDNTFGCPKDWYNSLSNDGGRFSKG